MLTYGLPHWLIKQIISPICIKSDTQMILTQIFAKYISGLIISKTNVTTVILHPITLNVLYCTKKSYYCTSQGT